MVRKKYRNKSENKNFAFRYVIEKGFVTVLLSVFLILGIFFIQAVTGNGEGERMIGIKSTPGNIDSCQAIDVSGEYIMNASISGVLPTRCININISDIVFDCNGFYIRSTSVSGPGFYVQNASNITIKNCNVTYSISGGTGIQFYNVSNSLIDNFTTNGNAYGIYVNGSSNINITNTNINGSGKYGIYLNSTSNSSISNVNTTFIKLIGIRLDNSHNNSIRNCNSSRNSDGVSNGTGIFLFFSNNNSLFNCTINNNYVTGFLMNSSSYNNFQSCSSNENALDISAGGINSSYFIDDSIGNYSIDLGGSLIFRNSLYGEIKFNDYINGSEGNFSDDVKILNNSAYVNSSQAGLNVSANVTLYNMSFTRGYLNQTILRNGVACNETTTPACYNLTSFRSSFNFNLSFKVDSWSNYSFYRGDYVAPPVVNLSSPLNDSNFTGRTYNVSFIFNVSSSAGVINCSAVVDGIHYINSSAINSTGNLIIANVSNGTHSGYVNCNDIAENAGNSSNVSFFINYTCVLVGCAGRCGSVDNGCGVTIDCGACGSGSSGGGGGGTISNPFWKKTIYETGRGYFVNKTISLSERERAIINLKGKNYTIGIVKLGYDYSIIYIDSIPQINITFFLGNSRKYDLNNDNYYDIILGLVSILDNQAQIKIDEINESIQAVKPLNDVNLTMEDKNKNITHKETPLVQDINKFIDKYNLTGIIWGGLGVILILMLVLITVAVRHVHNLKRVNIRR